jgi:hypothetical protein
LTRRRRSTRGLVIEKALLIAGVVAIYLFFTNGGPAFVGPIIAEWFTR